jgi:hypothetical protein
MDLTQAAAKGELAAAVNLTHNNNPRLRVVTFGLIRVP